MKKRSISFVLTAFIGYLAFYAFFYTAFLNTPVRSEKAETAFVEYEAPEIEKNEYLEQEKHLYDFISNHLMGDQGEVYSGLKLSGNREVLSESIGLIMNYAIIKDDRDLFDKELKYLTKYMLTEDKLLKWRISKGETYCNAAVDDLRIIRNLLEAYNLWQEEEYLNTAGFIQQSLYDKQVQTGTFYEFFNWKDNTVKERIPLCYLDIYTLDRVSMFNEGWGETANKGIDLIRSGRIKEDSPFFFKYYVYGKEQYMPDEEYLKSKGICLTYTLLTAMHLAEVNEDTRFFTQWLKEENRKGKLYAWYNPDSCKPAKKMESTAVYALGAVYADMVGEKELARELIGKMNKFRIKDDKSPFYGGYGDINSKSFYSFDNLTALWALAATNR